MFQQKYALFLVCFLVANQKISAQNNKLNAADKLALAALHDSTKFDALIQFNQSVQVESISKNLRSLGLSIYRFSGNKLSLNELTKDYGVKAINIRRLSVPGRIVDDSANRASRVPLVQGQPGTGILTPYSGKDIVVGIVDIGFQTNHPTFFDSLAKTYRVKRFWRQSDTAMAGPAGFAYGRLFTDKDAILSHRDSGEMHGTHVAGIAAGSGYGTANREFAGVAYDADLVFVDIKYSDDQYQPSAYGDKYVANAAIIDAYDYIFKYADSVQKPCVINLSWGMHIGPHDGTSLFDLAADALGGEGKVIVGAAGNDGATRIHLSHNFDNDTVSAFTFDNRRKQNNQEFVFVDAWGSKSSNFSVAVAMYDTLGNALSETEFFETNKGNTEKRFLISGADTIEVNIALTASFALNNCPNAGIEIRNNNPQERFAVLRFASKNTSLHAWNTGNPYRWSSGGFQDKVASLEPLKGFISGDGYHTVSENGGTGNKTISVAAYAATSAVYNINGAYTNTFYSFGQRAWFSSIGNRVDGRIKPDIAAPGVDVISAFNRYQMAKNGAAQDRLAASLSFNNETHYYGAASGTSMAAPHAAGIVALMLQAKPNLTPEQILEILKLSTITNDETGEVPNRFWGYGRLDAYKALLLAQAPVSVQNNLTENQQIILFPNPIKNQIRFLSNQELIEVDYVVFDSKGRKLKEGKLSGNELTIDLPQGVYFLTIQNPKYAHRFKFVVQ